MGSNVKTVTFADGTKKIPDYALSHTWSMLGNSITEVNLPDSLQSVGDYAFYGCSSVKVFDLPDSITTIGNYAFAGCSGAKTIDLPEELLHIGRYAFQGCTGVDFAIIPDKVRDIGDYAFQDCTALDSVKLNEGLLILGSGVFYNCPKLLKLRLPSTLTTAGHYYKQGPMYGSYVETVTVPKELREIPAYLFASDCFTVEDSEPYSRIETIEFEDIYELTGVGEYAFYGCVSLSGFSRGSGLPGAVGEIAPYTFYGCKKLTDFILEDGITVIGEYAFHGCEKLHTIYIPDTVQTIGAHAFSDCKALHTITIPAGATVGNCAYESCAGATSLTIGDGATIGMSAFFNCRKLKSITIGKNVTFMDRPFGSMQYYGDCTDTLSWNLNMETGLLTVSGTGAIPDYSVVDRAPWHPYGYFISELQIGGDVTAVGNYAFADLQRLESVVLHENIRRVGESAFSGCAALRYAQLPAGLQTLDKNAFDPCAGLETVQFMGNAPSLGDTCFGSKTVEVRYPSNAVGFTGRVKSRFPNVIWTVWEASQAAREIVILMDTSSDMAPYADTMVEAVGTIVNALGGLVPVDGAHGLVQHGGKADLIGVLGGGRYVALGHAGEGLAQQVRAQVRQTVQQLTGGLILPDGGLRHIDDVTGIHLPDQVHAGNAGLGQTVQHGPLVGRAAPVLGQEARVDVDASLGGDIQHPLGQDSAVGHHGADVGLQCSQSLHILVRPEILRLEDGDVMGQGHLLGGRSHQLHAPALGPVGLGVNADHLKAVGEDLFQTGRGNIRRTHKYNSQLETSKML